MIQQHWDNYTEIDHKVWQILFERQVDNLLDKVWHPFFECLPKASITANYVPNFKEVNKALSASTGWQVIEVEGLIPVDDFIRLLLNKKFPSSCWLRQMHQLDYLPEPDMFHDTFGHLPLLAHQDYSKFMYDFAVLGNKWLHEPALIKILERLYWYTIEFGLAQQQGKTALYGAGLISSFGEAKHIYTDAVNILPFNVEQVMLTPFKNNEIQNTYYCLHSMAQLWQCLAEAEDMLIQIADGKYSDDVLRLDEQVGSMSM
jgi:phenylalanine-4-hydroxylase